jgi:hypothetical protein
MPRFVVLTHDHPSWHWDFMLETKGVLRTWRLSAAPDTPGSIYAEPLPDHRLRYLEYEGPVSGDRGHVRRWDAGEYSVVDESLGRLEVRLQGKRLHGTAVLEAGETSGGPIDAGDPIRAPAPWTFHIVFDFG